MNTNTDTALSKMQALVETVQRRIDACCVAANTPNADYFDASTSLIIATRELLSALLSASKPVRAQPPVADVRAEQSGVGVAQGVSADFKKWFEREWVAYEDKAISGGKIVSMAWALKGYRAAATPQTDYEALEREHLGDPDKRTGIYALKDAQTERGAFELPPLPAPFEVDWPELHSQGLGCGVEDRGLHNRYECAEYGWQDGVDKAIERVPEEIFTAEQMREYARAALQAARSASPAAPAQSGEPIYQVQQINGTWKDVQPFEHPGKHGRVLFGAPQPSQPSAVVLDDERAAQPFVMTGEQVTALRTALGYLPISGDLWERTRKTLYDLMVSGYARAASPQATATQPAQPIVAQAEVKVSEERALTADVPDTLLVNLFYAAQGDITKFRIKARALLTVAQTATGGDHD